MTSSWHHHDSNTTSSSWHPHDFLMTSPRHLSDVLMTSSSWNHPHDILMSTLMPPSKRSEFPRVFWVSDLKLRGKCFEHFVGSELSLRVSRGNKATRVPPDHVTTMAAHFIDRLKWTCSKHREANLTPILTFALQFIIADNYKHHLIKSRSCSTIASSSNNCFIWFS